MALQNRAVLIMLQEKSVKAVEAAQKQFAAAIKKVDDAKNQSKVLEEYKQGYRDSLQESMEKGLSVDTLQNYQSFLNKLDDALSSQSQVIEMAEAELAVYRNELQTCQKKKLSYDVLLDRADKQRKKQEDKQDQKMMDEYALRAASKSSMH